MSIRLEDYLENPNLLTKKISLENTIDAIINDGRITNTPLTEDEILVLGTDTIPDYLINDPEIVGYPSAEMQEEIYQWVRQHLPVQNYSIKDCGAGRGDFYRTISNSGELDIQYTGIEIKPALIQSGQLKYSGFEFPKFQLIHSDYLNVNIQTDYTVCIGTLNDRHEEDKWEYFNKTLNHALSNTKQAVIFVLSSNMDDLDNFYDYPLNELFQNLPSNLPCKLDYSKFQDIYVLVVYVQPFT